MIKKYMIGILVQGVVWNLGTFAGQQNCESVTIHCPNAEFVQTLTCLPELSDSVGNFSKAKFYTYYVNEQ
jgi:hypothetical protein